MFNNISSRLIGSVVGAAVIIAGLVAFGPIDNGVHHAGSRPLATPVAVLHASETITVRGN